MPHPVIEQLVHPIAETFAGAGHLIGFIGNNTGLAWGITEEELFWFRPPGFHVFEYLVFLPPLVFLFLEHMYPYLNRVLYEAKAVKKPMYMADRVMGGILLACWLTQLVLKVIRVKPLVQIFWLCMPCHIITITWAVVLLMPPSMKNYAYCRFVASILTMSSWGGFLASIFPDFSDHIFPPYEGYIFFVHHGILLIMPHYWIARHGLLPMSKGLFFSYCCSCISINYYVFTPLSYISGINVNYNLHPHVGMIEKQTPFASSKWYRFIVPIFLFVYGFSYYMFTIGLNKIYFYAWHGMEAPDMMERGREVSSALSPVGPSKSVSPSATPPAKNMKKKASTRRR